MNEVEFYLEDLKSKFGKINPNEYYLAYSGGRDSHFLLWFIREYLHETRIPAVFSNTGMEIPEIRDRGLANADVVLKPAMKHAEIKEKFGIPLNSKAQDYFVWEWQKRIEKGFQIDDMPDWLKWVIYRDAQYAPESHKGMESWESVNKKTRNALLSGKLHKVSNKCCEFLKKQPAKKYQQKETGKRSIIGIMGAESWRRQHMLNHQQGCFNKKGDFYPIHDLSEELRTKIEEYCGIPVPYVYQYVRQTGCAGCPYGQHGKNPFEVTNIGLSLCGEGQRKFILDYFAESYAFKGYNFQPRLFI
jgi:3'-phosphoadenosine 5'-phosphosulfate sulfotransferase (PAPS reductase)/FAD synthetase